MLTSKQIALLQDELATAKNPLFIHDGDGDGLCSFLLLYRIHKEGKRIALTASSRLTTQMLPKVQEIGPDKIFILDIPMVDQEFLDHVNSPTFWIDHHPVQDRSKVTYFNPRIKDDSAYIPTTRMAYQVSQNTKDLWLATAGCLADFFMPDFIDDFIKAFPTYLSKKEDLATILFKRPAGKLVKLFFFLQKGPSSDVQKSIKVLTRIEHPDEIFKQTTPQGKFLYQRFQKINQMYEELLGEAKKSVTRSKLVLFYYTEKKWSFTANLANELSGRHPQKYIIIARSKGGKMKCSFRGKNVIQPLQTSLQGLRGGGGGHPDACGAVIDQEDWDQFLKRFKEDLKNV